MELVVNRGKNAFNSEQYMLGYFITLRYSCFVDFVQFFIPIKPQRFGNWMCIRRQAKSFGVTHLVVLVRKTSFSYRLE